MNATLGISKRGSIGGAGFGALNGGPIQNGSTMGFIPPLRDRERDVSAGRPQRSNVALITDGREEVRNSFSATGRLNGGTGGGAVRSSLAPSQGPSSPGAKRITRAASQPAMNIRGDTPDGPSGIIHTVESLRVMCEDSLWSNRLRGFEIINERLNRILAQRGAGGGEEGYGRESFSASSSNIEGVLDMAVLHLGDAHQKVAVEAMSVLGTCVQSFTAQTLGKLGVLLAALFNRLADRRAQIK
jgi:hypothetical protein